MPEIAAIPVAGATVLVLQPVMESTIKGPETSFVPRNNVLLCSCLQTVVPGLRSAYDHVHVERKEHRAAQRDCLSHSVCSTV